MTLTQTLILTGVVFILLVAWWSFLNWTLDLLERARHNMEDS